MENKLIMPTLLEALEEKYGCPQNTIDNESEQHELLVSIFVPKKPPRQS